MDGDRLTRTKGPRFYRTSKSAQKSVSEIVELLGEFGASSYHVQNRNGQPQAIAFAMPTPTGDLAFKIEPEIEGIRKRTQTSASAAEPEAIAWAQARHFIELQLEIIESGTFRPAQIWAGFTLVNSGETIAEMIEHRADELLPGERLMLPGGA